jgi:hypothetical protein
MRSNSVEELNGLVMRKLAPQSRASVTLERRTWAAVKRTGAKALGSSPERRSQRTNSNPLMPGMSLSTRIRSTGQSFKMAMASAALVQAWRTFMPNPSRAWMVSSMANGESSMTMVTAPEKLTMALSRRVSPTPWLVRIKGAQS